MESTKRFQSWYKPTQSNILLTYTDFFSRLVLIRCHLYCTDIRCPLISVCLHINIFVVVVVVSMTSLTFGIHDVKNLA
jgi:hypothetical protein